MVAAGVDVGVRPPDDGHLRARVVGRTVAEHDRAGALEVARRFTGIGFSIVATEGTRKYLSDNGIPASPILKMHEGRPNIADAVVNGQVALVINTPLGRASQYDEKAIRAAAVARGVTCVTTLQGATAAVAGVTVTVVGVAWTTTVTVLVTVRPSASRTVTLPTL